MNLNSRLFNLSNNGRLDAWRAALHAFQAHRAAGLGSDGFEQYWNTRRPAAVVVRDGRSLHLETLAEMSIVVLLIILVAALAARSAKALESGHASRAGTDASRARFSARWSSQPWQRLSEVELVQGQRTQRLASFRTALTKDPWWQLWVGAGKAEHGQAGWNAFVRALQLNPYDPAIRRMAQQLLPASVKKS